MTLAMILMTMKRCDTAGTRSIYVRYGALIDKFNGRGGNGGKGTRLDCGSGNKISGYNMKCGSLVDKVQFKCSKCRKTTKIKKKRSNKARKCVGKTRKLNLKKNHVSQSSTGHGGKAARAVDGNTNGKYGSGSCTHTNKQNRPWWKVNLGSKMRIRKVVVWNRADCCTKRLNNFNVYVDSRKCGSVGTAHRKNTISCGNKWGRNIKVQLKGKEYLTLAIAI